MKTLFILISLFFAVSLSARQRDSRVREYLPPARIVWQQESQFWKRTARRLANSNRHAGFARTSRRPDPFG